MSRTIEREQEKLKGLKSAATFRTSALGSLQSFGGGLLTVASAALKAGAAVTALGVGAAGLFTRSALQATAGIERMQTALETLEGSQGAAQRSMDWIIKFSDETPFELEQVGDAFTRLRAYGIDPTDGTLRTLGDTAASMGKDVMQAVEAMADAVTGETERLKEFGIRSSTEGKRLTFFYKNALGEDVKKTVDKTSQTAIRTTLAAIWNEKYAGSMQKASRTWDGLMSTLRSKWTLFQVRVMRSGVFDALKGQLVGLLDSINRWAEDGTLDRWANQIGAAYAEAFRAVSTGFQWVRANWPEIKRIAGELWEGTKLVAGGLFDLGKGFATLSSWTVRAAGGWDRFKDAVTSVGPLRMFRDLVSAGITMLEWMGKAIAFADTL